MSPVAVALNGRFSGTAQPTGTQTVAFHLFDAIVRAERDVPLVVFADPQFAGVSEWGTFPRTLLVSVPFQNWSRGKAQLWEQFALPGLCRKFHCPLAHHPITTSPFWRRGVGSLVTVHDLNFLRAEWYSASFRSVYRFTALSGIRRAEQIVTISDYVRQQVQDRFGIPGEKITRIYNGVKPLACAAPAAVKPPPYVLCVGSLQPHKNLARLIRAFQQLRGELPDLELWVVGRPQPRFREQPELAELLQSAGVKVLGYLSEEALGRAYADARVFCYPSLEEGFGLPLLESMMAGTPVVTSNVSVLPEVAGPAAELVDPLSVESLAAGLRKVLSLNPAARAKRVAAGLQWATQFTWSRAAQEYLELYRRLLA